MRTATRDPNTIKLQLAQMQEYVSELLRRQNFDGGWGWHPGKSSWTEPTAYALIALAAAGASEPERKKGTGWLLARQSSDGGWSPHSSVQQSTSVTAIASLVPEISSSGGSYDRAISWLLAQKARSGLVRPGLINRLLGAPDVPTEYPGWSFVPGTAAWTVPTALGILALSRASRVRPDVVTRVEEARRFLESRVCKDGGWNYGPPSTLDIDADSYPETTGIALLALHGVHSPVVERAVSTGLEMLRKCNSADAAGWLVLALSAHSRQLPPVPVTRPRTTGEIALAVLAHRAVGGTNLLLEKV